MAIFPGLGRFKEFWCQKVLPLVYDDSLSFYEVLCRIKAKLNEVIENLNAQGKYIETQLPTLVDETVRKYFNQNQNLPFIDCYAHGITEKLDDIGPALQALINQYGAGYAYYMRGNLNYNLKSTVNFPQYLVLHCDGGILANFEGVLVLQSFDDIYIKILQGTSQLVYPLATHSEGVSEVKIKIWRFVLCKDIFKTCKMNTSQIDIDFCGMDQILYENITLIDNGVITIGHINTSSDQVIFNFGSTTINNSTITIHGGYPINVLAGNALSGYFNLSLSAITTGVNSTIFANSAVFTGISMGNWSKLHAKIISRNSALYNEWGIMVVDGLSSFLNKNRNYLDLAPGGGEFESYQEPFLIGLKMSNHEYFIPDEYWYRGVDFIMRIEPGVNEVIFNGNVQGIGHKELKTIFYLSETTQPTGWKLLSGKTYHIRCNLQYNSFFIQNLTDNEIIANVASLPGYMRSSKFPFSDDYLSKVYYANTTTNPEPDSGTGD